MRSSGFPCRSGGCARSFSVADQNSMVALKTASDARTSHEIADHDYRHVTLPDAPRVISYRAPRRPKDAPTIT